MLGDRTTHRYFSLPATGALLVDYQNCAWPLRQRVMAYFAPDLTPPLVKLIQYVN